MDGRSIHREGRIVTSTNSPVRKRIRYSLSWSSSNNDTRRNQHEIINDPEIENAIVAIDKVCSSDFSQNIERETSQLSELSIDKSKSDLSSESDSEILPNQSNTGCDNSTIDDNNNHHKNETDTADNINPVKNPEEELKSAITKVAILDGKFFVVDFNKSTIKNISAKCQFCPGAKFYKGSLRATSNFSSHLKAVHKLHYDEYKEYLKIKKNDSTNVSTVDKKRWSCCFNQEKFEENLTHFVLDSMLPINVVERPSFRQIFNNLQIKKGESQLVHLSRYSLGKRIKTYCEESFNEIRQHLESVTTNGGFVCTTADVWTSGSRRFLGVTVSWIDQKSLARKSAAIACRRFPGTHSFDAIAKKLFEIHTSFGLTSENIRATVTDNGSNFIKAFKEFGVDVTDKDLFDLSELSCDDDEENSDAFDDNSVRADEEFDLECEIALPQHLRCASHTLNLIATKDISKGIEASQVLKKKHTNVVRKCSSLWKQLRFPKKNEYMKSHLGVSLKKPVITRWNSFYDCIKQILSVKDKLLQADIEYLKYKFSKSDFVYLYEYITCTSDLALAIDRLQADNCHYGILFPELVCLKSKLQKLLESKKISVCEPILHTIIENIDIRFANFFNFSQCGKDAAIASVSHPKFKGSWLGYFSSKTQLKIYKWFEDAVKTEKIEKSPENSQNNEKDEYDFGDYKSNIISKFEISVTQAAVDVEITGYLRSAKQNCEMLNDHPLVKKVFLKYNTPLPSSASVERLFNYATMINLPKYNRYNDTNFENRVLTKANASKQL